MGVKTVVNERGQLKGYLFNSVYIKKEWCRYLIRDGSALSTSKERVRYNSNYKSVLSLDEIEEFIRFCKSKGVVLNNCIFLPCDMTLIPNEDFTELRGVVTNLCVKKLNCYVCYEVSSGRKLGYLVSTDNLYSSESFHISLLETCKKGRGYGTKIIKQLNCMKSSITGVSVITAKGFWEKQGANFIGNSSFII